MLDYQGKIDTSRTCVTVADLDQPFAPLIYVNNAFLGITGYEKDEVLGRNCRFLQGEGTNRRTTKDIGQALRDGKPIDRALVNYRKDGEPFINYLSLQPLPAIDAQRLVLGCQFEVFHSGLDDISMSNRAEQFSKDSDGPYSAIWETIKGSMSQRMNMASMLVQTSRRKHRFLTLQDDPED